MSSETPGIDTPVRRRGGGCLRMPGWFLLGIAAFFAVWLLCLPYIFFVLNYLSRWVGS